VLNDDDINISCPLLGRARGDPPSAPGLGIASHSRADFEDRQPRASSTSSRLGSAAIFVPARAGIKDCNHFSTSDGVPDPRLEAPGRKAGRTDAGGESPVHGHGFGKYPQGKMLAKMARHTTSEVAVGLPSGAPAASPFETSAAPCGVDSTRVGGEVHAVARPVGAYVRDVDDPRQIVLGSGWVPETACPPTRAFLGPRPIAAQVAGDSRHPGVGIPERSAVAFETTSATHNGSPDVACIDLGRKVHRQTEIADSMTHDRHGRDRDLGPVPASQDGSGSSPAPDGKRARSAGKPQVQDVQMVPSMLFFPSGTRGEPWPTNLSAQNRRTVLQNPDGDTVGPCPSNFGGEIGTPVMQTQSCSPFEAPAPPFSLGRRVGPWPSNSGDQNGPLDLQTESFSPGGAATPRFTR
jgi:hypothetical protein